MTSERLGMFLLATVVPSRAFFRSHSHRVPPAVALTALKSVALASIAGTRAQATRTEGSVPSHQFCTMTTGEFSSRSVDQVILSRPQPEGNGARVHRSIGSYNLRNFDPFLLLDEFDVDPGAGFPDHPHRNNPVTACALLGLRGFETVTYMLKGTVEHQDFCGHRGKIGPGSLQWMTAGRGIVHSEMPYGEEKGQGLQLWVNLKAKDKMVPPAYQELDKDEIPTVTKDGVTAIVIAGEALGVSSPVYTRTPVDYIHFKMGSNTELQQPIPENMNAFLYILSGRAAIGGDLSKEQQIGPRNTVTLKQVGAGIAVKTFDSPVDFVLICGEPTNEPIVQQGLFVMNTREEIQQAMLDYKSGTNGFENATKWYSEIGLPLTRADRRRR